MPFPLEVKHFSSSGLEEQAEDAVFGRQKVIAVHLTWGWSEAGRPSFGDLFLRAINTIFARRNSPSTIRTGRPAFLISTGS